VQCGTGVSLLPLATVNKEVTLHSLVAIPLGGEPLSRPLGIIHRKNRQLTPPVLKLIENLRLELGTATATVAAEATGPTNAVAAKTVSTANGLASAAGSVAGEAAAGRSSRRAGGVNASSPVAKAPRKPG